MRSKQAEKNYQAKRLARRTTRRKIRSATRRYTKALGRANYLRYGR